MSKKSRPVFLNLLQIKFPVTAIISIGHRITGVVLMLSLPLWLYAFSHAVASPLEFESLATCFNYLSTKIFVILSVSAAWYHVFAGLRHLIMDFGFFESLFAARITAYITIALTVLSIIFLWSKVL